MAQLISLPVRQSKIALQFYFNTRFLSRKGMSEENELSQCDNIQVKLMNQECIAVDDHDRVIGSKSKLKCHLQSDGLQLHRAFSLFVFNSKNELLMQRRSDAKITFPGQYTNSCCSHPLHCINELEENGNIGVKRAAQRRLHEELGVPTSQLPLESIKFLSRVHYKAKSDDKWGEHEIDYVLFAHRDVDLNINPNEVSEVKYISMKKFDDFNDECKKRGISLTPWFKLIAETQLFQWWENLDNLEKFTDQQQILRLT